MPSGEGGNHPIFDLLLTDVVMPGRLQGPALARALRRRRPDLPVLFMTGHAPDDSLWDEGSAAGVPVLYKPLRRRELLAAIDAALKADDRPARKSADEGKEPAAWDVT